MLLNDLLDFSEIKDCQGFAAQKKLMLSSVTGMIINERDNLSKSNVCNLNNAKRKNLILFYLYL